MGTTRRRNLIGVSAVVVFCVGAAVALGRARSCSEVEAPPDAAPVVTASASSEADAAPPPSATADAAPPQNPREPKVSCPREMVAVAGKYCVDKWEASLVDKRTGQPISPYYPPDKPLAIKLAEQWGKMRLEVGDEKARAMDLPPLPGWQRQRAPEPMAVSRAGVLPNGYLTGVIAAIACKNAGKRLCSHGEWQRACRGEADRQFPYGESYQQGACNIFRRLHPAKELHDNASIGHTDPRLNLVKDGTDPLLRRTGATAKCKSAWGDDAAWDMNGNLDEWVDDEKGRFDGGFFSRSKKDGCDSTVSAHPNTYFDYSTGVRCCSDGTPAIDD